MGRTRRRPDEPGYWVLPERSRDLTRSPWYPHFRHWTALGGFRAEQFMQIFLLSRRSIASGNGMGPAGTAPRL